MEQRCSTGLSWRSGERSYREPLKFNSHTALNPNGAESWSGGSEEPQKVLHATVWQPVSGAAEAEV